MPKATPKQRVTRQRALVVKYAGKVRSFRKRLRWAIAKRTVHRGKLKKARAALEAARRRHRQAHPKFESYMLNGCPGGITPEAEDAIARGVVQHDCVVTATTNGTHVATSFHYPRNNSLHGYSDTLGHAVDFGGPLGTYDVFYAAEKKRGCSNYDELFGPGDGYCDERASHPGAAPDVPNHCHNAPVHKD
jgi:hypothetical protein